MDRIFRAWLIKLYPLRRNRCTPVGQRSFCPALAYATYKLSMPYPSQSDLATVVHFLATSHSRPNPILLKFNHDKKSCALYARLRGIKRERVFKSPFPSVRFPPWNAFPPAWVRDFTDPGLMIAAGKRERYNKAAGKGERYLVHTTVSIPTYTLPMQCTLHGAVLTTERGSPHSCRGLAVWLIQTVLWQHWLTHFQA